MKTIIAGSRDITDYNIILAAVLGFDKNITEVVSGGARGADALGEEWADNNRIPIKRFPADWARYGKSAGPRRNEQMARYADALIACWDGESKGTKSMINLAREAGLMVYVHPIPKQRSRP